MLKIGEFSKLSGVSVRMLRHYDEIGLLKPAETDRFTDYRYYREDQLPTVCRITALKDMGFPLADIIRILEIYDDKDKLEGYFSDRQRELRQLSQDILEACAAGLQKIVFGVAFGNTNRNPAARTARKVEKSSGVCGIILSVRS